MSQQHHPQYGDTKVSREEYTALRQRLEEEEAVKKKVLAITGENVLKLFLSSNSEVGESETVDKKNLGLHYFTIRNSVLLDLTEDSCSSLQPLSNLSLRVNLMVKLQSLLQSNHQLKSALSAEETENFQFFCDTVEDSVGRREEFLTDTKTAQDIVIFYHTFRNKVLREMMSQLSGLVTSLQNILINTESSTDKTYSRSITQLKSLIGLPWEQQVKAIEDMDFELNFLEKFQSFWFEKILSQTSDDLSHTEAEGEDPDVPPAYKVPNRIARIHRCNFCSYSSKKMSNIKTHIKGKHRKLNLEPGDIGFTTHFNPGEDLSAYDISDSFSEKSLPKSEEEVPSQDEDLRALKSSKCPRIHHCNFCEYQSPKSSNIKTHLKGKHRNIEMENIELGFTTEFKAKSVTKTEKKEKKVKKVKKEEVQDEWNSSDIKMEPGEVNEENLETKFDNEDVPSLEDFLDININIGSRNIKKKSKKTNNYYDYDSDDSFINDDSEESDDDRSYNPEYKIEVENMKTEVEDMDEFGKQKDIFEEAGKSFLYEMENHCHTCNANFSAADSDKWRQHMFQHSSVKPFECPYVGCEKAFTKQEVLNKHVKTHSKEKPFVCSYEGCEQSFTRNWYLKVHLETAHQEVGEDNGGENYEVKLRDQSGGVVESVEKARTGGGNRLHQCKFCNYASNKKSNIKQHVKGVHKNVDLEPNDLGFTTLVKPFFDCPDCDFTTTTHSGLQKHTAVAHDKSEVPINCDHCGFQATSRAAMASHKKESHSAAKVFMCDQCDYSATREEYLRKHIKFYHDGETRPVIWRSKIYYFFSSSGFRYLCDKCEITFKCPKSLEDHTNSVHEGWRNSFSLEKIKPFLLQGYSTSVISVTTSVVTGPASSNIIKRNIRTSAFLVTNANIRPKTRVLSSSTFSTFI